MAKRARGQPTREPTPDRPVRIERKIYLCGRTDGTTYYRVDFRTTDGRRVREPAGESLTEARRLRTQREHEVNTGTYEHPDDKRRREESERARAAAEIGPTFNTFADRFEREYASQRRSDYYSLALRPIRAYFGERRLREIRPADLDAYRTHCLTVDRVSASTTRKRLTIIGTVFRHAVRWNVIDTNPAADLAKPSEPEHRTRYLSREEWTRLHDHAEPWLRPILTVAVLTGARLKEVAGMTWENVDRTAGVMFVSEDNKTGKPRGVPISPPVRAILDGISRFKRSGFVFADAEGNPYMSRRQRNRISQRTKAAAKAADLGGVTFHVLRHTFGSWAAQSGCSLVEIGRMLGHRTPTMTLRYSHLSPAHLRGVADAVAAVANGHEKDTTPPTATSHPEPTPAILSGGNNWAVSSGGRAPAF